MHVLPMARGLGCLVSNASIVDRSHENRRLGAPSEADLRAAYVDDKGVVTMCVHCRRTKRLGSEQVWDWVPEFIEKPPETVSQDICPACLAYFSAQAEVS